MAATKSPAERAREEKKRAEAAAAAEKRAAAPVLTEAEKRMFAGAAGGGKSFEFPPFDASTAAIWYDEIGRHMPPPTPPPGLPPAHPPAWLNGFVDRLTAIDRALAALSARLDLIDSTVLNIQQELRRDRT